MTDLKIEKGVPFPEGGRGLNNSTAKKMEPGDSVLVSTYSKAQSLAQYLKRHQKTYVTKPVDGGFRVWCTGYREKK